MEYVLKTESIKKRYGNHDVLKGLSMNVPKGSIYGFIGKTVQEKLLQYGSYAAFRSLQEENIPSTGSKTVEGIYLHPEEGWALS